MNLLSSKLRVSLFCLGLAALAPACGDSESKPEVDCQSGPIPTYSEVAVLTTNCANCHSTGKTGAARENAPVAVNFDTYDAAKKSAEQAVIEVYGGSMPPAGKAAPTEAQKQALYKWALCGTPQ
jgi:uncharacterized membrane protein